MCARARQLAERLGDGQALFTALWGAGCCDASHQTPEEMLERVQELVTVAQQLEDPGCLIVALDTVGSTYYFLARPAQARPYFARAQALFDPQKHRSLALQ